MPANPTTIATSRVEFTTAARPEQVWGALTRPELTARYLFGIALRSDWRSGSPVVVAPPPGGGCAESLGGEVLAVAEGRRLSYTLTSGPADPTTFVSWEVEPCAQGARVSLYVDETQLAPAPAGEVDAAWLQAVTSLQAVLASLLR